MSIRVTGPFAAIVVLREPDALFDLADGAGGVVLASGGRRLLREHGVVKGGPSTWDHDELVIWVAGQDFGAAVEVPAKMTGKMVS